GRHGAVLARQGHGRWQADRLAEGYDARARQRRRGREGAGDRRRDRLRRVLVRAAVRAQNGRAAEPGRPVRLSDGDHWRPRAVGARRPGAPARLLGRRPGNGGRLSDPVLQLDAALSALSRPLQGGRAARLRGMGIIATGAGFSSGARLPLAAGRRDRARQADADRAEGLDGRGRRSRTGETYYRHWLATLKRVVAHKGVTDA